MSAVSKHPVVIEEDGKYEIISLHAFNGETFDMKKGDIVMETLASNAMKILRRVTTE